MNWVAFPSHSLQRIANIIDRLIVLLAFVLLIFMSGKISLMDKKVHTVGNFFGQHVAGNERSPRVHSNNEGDMDSPAPSLPIVSGEENSLDIDSVLEAVQEDDDYDKAKKYCDNFPERPTNDSSQNKLCTHLSKAIEYSNVCVNLYQNLNAKRKYEDLAKEMRIWHTRAQNLKAEHVLMCGESPGI
jgi:hypothetical protein